jgi:hypothetical protein
MRDAEGSTCPAIMVDFAVVRWALSRARADDSFSVSAATVDLISVVAELVLNDAGSGSIGRLAAARSKQLNLFASVHDSMAACGGKRQLQPTKVAASAPMRSVLMHSSLEAEFRSHFLLRRHVALVVYLLSENIKRSLSVRPPPREALAWLMSVQRTSRHASAPARCGCGRC